MADKPRNPRRGTDGPTRASARPKTGGPGDRPRQFGRGAGKPATGPAGPRTVAGVDRRTMELLEKEGLLTGEARRLLEGSEAPARGARGVRRGGAERPARDGERPARSVDGPRSPRVADRPARPGERPARVTVPVGQRPARPAGPRRLTDAESTVAQRLQKVMAQAGVASRRHSEELIQAGRVTVNGKVVTELGTKVIPGKDIVEVDGRPLGKPEETVHIILNKPKGYVTTLYDPQERPKVTDLLGGEVGERVYPVGRLDYDTEGLLLLTNDGELANALMHPAKMVKKTYIAKVRGVPGPAKLKALEQGIELDDGPTAPAEVKLIDAKGPNAATLSIRIHEGRNRQVRRMLEAVGHEVIHLKRTTLGPLHLKELSVGHWRYLTEQEVLGLRSAAGFTQPRSAVVAAITEQRRGRRGASRFATDRRGAPVPKNRPRK